ncbi:MAG: hypothetical protein M3460_16905 [Actinomycetota bacterium]|nr:hypothetical protein [Actinomycetota bacterium]
MILVDTGPIVAVVNNRDDHHQVVTLDRRDFGIVRPAHVSALTLLP